MRRGALAVSLVLHLIVLVAIRLPRERTAPPAAIDVIGVTLDATVPPAANPERAPTSGPESGPGHEGATRPKPPPAPPDKSGAPTSGPPGSRSGGLSMRSPAPDAEDAARGVVPTPGPPSGDPGISLTPPAPPPGRPQPVLRRRADGSYETKRTPFTMHVDPDGTARFDDERNLQFDGLTHGHFDVTDAVLRAMGNDPYQYEKEKLLDQTRPERMRMAERARRARLDGSIHGLPRKLDALWKRKDLPAAERRRLLFLLWDECAEAGDGRADITKAGAQARALIEAFIRRRLPASSPHAFTPDELAAYDRTRNSRAHFDPYRSTTTHRQRRK